MAAAKKRIGFILASIHTGSAPHLWRALAEEVKKTQAAFFIFPGGRLDAKDDYEYLRNSVYRLANTDNLDNLISWGSSLSGAVSIEVLDDFHRAFEPLPYVTIAHKMSGHPSVRFDAYTGMKSLIRHFIEEHGAKKIAFLRAPEQHVSAVDRFNAYCDTLAEAGFERDVTLVSSPFPWTEGEAAIRELCETRNLVPGRDFDTLIAASDLLALPAVLYLQKKGFAVPETVRAGGFNDSAESRIISPPLSTVHMPYAELGIAAFGMLENTEGDSDRVLPAKLVVRESCGCKNIRKFFESAETAVRSSETLSALKEKTAALFHCDCEKTLDGLFSALNQQNTGLFFGLFEKSLGVYFLQNSDVAVFFEAAALVRTSSLFSLSYLQKIESRFFALISQMQDLANTRHQYQTELRHEVLNSLKCGLLTSRSRESLIDLLALHLPQIGIRCAAVILYENDDYSVCLGGFCAPERQKTRRFAGTIRFPARLLVPQELQADFQSGIFMVQPLFMENQPLGALICSVPFSDGAVFEELRSALSSALKGIFLFEEVSQAKQRAEAAERSQSEFFANIGTDLCDPLFEILNKIDQIQQAMKTGLAPADSLLAQMIFLKSAVQEQLSKTNLLMDVTLSQLHELPLEKRLFTVLQAVPQNMQNRFVPDDKACGADFPLLYGDPARLLQVFELLSADFIPAPCDALVFNADGVRFSFVPRARLSTAVWQKPELLLAAHIMLLQYGELRKKGKDGCEIIFPLPNLACLPPVKSAAGQKPLELRADSVGDEDWERLYALRNDASVFRSPAMVFASCFQSKTFMEEMEKRLQNKSSRIILFVGEKQRYPLWADDSQCVSASSIDEFALTLETCEPAVIVLDSLDCAAVDRIRHTPKTVLTPILLLPVRINEEETVQKLSEIQRLVLCNRAAAESEEFAARVRSIISGGEMLPPHTGALVKRAIVYLNKHADSQITRWKMADAVHVSEDYLTRIFHKETGLSPWEYLNRCRIFKACDLLLHTGKTLYEIASDTGFQDQAYFCRVFKKITGMPPGHYRDPNKQNTLNNY